MPGGGDGEQRGEACAVIGDAGAEKFSVARNLYIFGRARGEYGIEMGGDGNGRRIAAALKRCDYVAGAIDLGVPIEVPKTGGDPFGALLFEEGRGGDAAEFEVLLLNPKAFAAEPVEGGSHTRRRGKIGDGLGKRGQVLVYTLTG